MSRMNMRAFRKTTSPQQNPKTVKMKVLIKRSQSFLLSLQTYIYVIQEKENTKLSKRKQKSHKKLSKKK